MAQLEGKVAIITGASSGIGRVAAHLFAAEGARVVLGARRDAALHSTAAQIRAAGGEAFALAGDIRDEGYAAALTACAAETYGGLDIAFNNAGDLGALGPAHTLSRDDWTRTIETNLTGAFLCAKHQVPALLARGAGSIIFTSTFVGHTVGFPGAAAYAAAKAGLIGLTQVMAAELGPSRVRVNALLSGGADTPMGAIVANSEEARKAVESLHALKRVAAPEEIARVALFLASDAASFVTGSALLADGGVSISRS